MSVQNPIFIPGPTNMPEDVRRACDMPTLDHRSAAYRPIFKRAVEGVKAVMNTRTAEVIIFPSTGTGGWEAAICNTLSPGDKVLAARHGMFSQKWIDMCQRHGLDVQIVEAPWGGGVPVAAFQKILADDTDHEIKAVLVTHNETATGVTSSVADVRGAMDASNHPALLLVDGVSSIASLKFDFDAWGVDVAVAGSQKGFMMPPGLAICTVSPKAVAAIADARLPRTYFDFADMLRTNGAGGYPYTPSVGLLNGLGHACEKLLDEGMDHVAARHHRLAEGVRQAVAAWGMRPCASSPELYSDTVTAIMVPDGFDGNELVAYTAREYGMSFGSGLGEVAGKVFRIGHLGSLTDAMVLSGLATIEMAMVDLGYPVTLGSGVAAAQEFYRSTKEDAQRAAA